MSTDPTPTTESVEHAGWIEAQLDREGPVFRAFEVASDPEGMAYGSLLAESYIRAARAEERRLDEVEQAAMVSDIATSIRLRQAHHGWDVESHAKSVETVEMVLPDVWQELGLEAPQERLRGSPKLGLTAYADIQPLAVHWLWRGRIPLGMLSILDGDPGLGKSTLACDLAARVTRGAPMPDGTPGVQGAVILMTAEDDEARTIRPRLNAAGARVERVFDLGAVEGSEPEIPNDLERIEAAIVKEEAKLLVIDPIVAYLGTDAGKRISYTNDQEVRRALTPLRDVAVRTGCAVLMVRHLNKDARNAKAIYRGGGSIGFTGACRSNLLLGADPDDAELRVLAVPKGNLAPDSWKTSMQFRLVQGSPAAATIRWEGESDRSGDDLLRSSELPEGALREAMDFLTEILANGPMLSDELSAKAKERGIAFATYKRARKALEIEAVKQRFSGRWESRLPTRSSA